MEDARFLEEFKDELTKGKGDGKRTLDKDVVTYEVFKDEEVEEKKGTFVPIRILLSVGGRIVHKREFATSFGTDKEILTCNHRFIYGLIREIPFMCLAIDRYIKERKNKTLEEKAFEGVSLIAEVVSKMSGNASVRN